MIAGQFFQRLFHALFKKHVICGLEICPNSFGGLVEDIFINLCLFTKNVMYVFVWNIPSTARIMWAAVLLNRNTTNGLITQRNHRRQHINIDLETIRYLCWANNSSPKMCWKQLAINSTQMNQLDTMPDICSSLQEIQTCANIWALLILKSVKHM